MRKFTCTSDVIKQRLTDWFNGYKCASSGSQPARGRFDPNTDLPLFTEDTKKAHLNCLDKAEGVVDLLEKDELHMPVQPSLKSKSKLCKWISLRGWCRIEARESPSCLGSLC